ncbi:TPA: acyltransferase [Escherichia coli]|uniref:acyltransferase family protein n=1 Tax=Enterobacteriaceae TaxID=543 RepID=UPI0009C18F4B|nr:MULTISPECIES: acyltransferase family protein [Enterobacteriaceae]EFN8428088.1 acyltransferase [Escherichia coli O113]HDR9867894.1 acyltransferase [Escherichia coli 88817 (10j)]EEW1831092.1 acyltransferase [Escherichia coli]EFH7486220.1 acyltransferase family protein [Escherichia coli]EFH9280580.1 acyltransferase family protein [Escherichia coli]
MSVFSSTAKTNSSTYQPGVDGLRAVAVLLVLLFHAGFESIPGGFIGVDVFFVISGYLISGIIFSQLDKKSFSFIRFICSRISRLYPALIFTLFIVFIGCFLVYTPSEFAEVSKSAIYSIFSASNIFFASKAGYFDNSSEINPLLHTWSLAVEQQFYIIWPVILSLSFLINRKIVPYVIGVVALSSLAASQWATVNSPVDSYYLMPFRTFELAFGGLTYFASKKIKLNNSFKEVTMLFGLAAIIAPSIYFTSSTKFPGLNAMIPVFGAMLCIISQNSKISGFVVNNRLSVGLGIISYSIYLIHWPILVIYKYWVFRPLDLTEKVSIVIVSIVAGYAMYNIIENKFRKINILSLSRGTLAGTSALILVLASFSSAYLYGGFPFRVSDKSALSFSDAKKYHDANFGGGNTPQGRVSLGDASRKPSIIILGDSIARQYALAIDEDLKARNKSAVAFFEDGCFMSESYSRLWNGNPGMQCNKAYKDAISMAKQTKLPLIYAQSWLGYRNVMGEMSGKQVHFNNDEDYQSFMVKNIERINSEIPSKLTVILGANGSGGVSGTLSCVARPSYLPLVCRDNMVSVRGRSASDKMNNFIKTNSPSDVNVVSVNDVICEKDKCFPVTKSGEILYSDYLHFNKSTAKKVWEAISRKIEM